MKDLIEALQIFAKYVSDEESPTSCDHEALYVSCPPEAVSEGDMLRLEQLSFIVDDEYCCFVSYRFGSC